MEADPKIRFDYLHKELVEPAAAAVVTSPALVAVVVMLFR
jgi:hypothetical protein